MEISEAYYDVLVIGSGAAGLAAALRLAALPLSAALITEDRSAGCSRNAGSDKQTYYKLTLGGGEADSVADMARDLFAGGAADGPHALCEAALSARGFHFLQELGVPFPENEYGEAVGYKTDHDPRRRATSAGPYTSRMMAEALDRALDRSGVPVLDGYQCVKLLTAGGRIRGVLCLKGDEPRLIWCRFAVLATGGPAGIWQDSVYPAQQRGASGMAFAAGVRGRNLTEWQFGLASLSPRWNVSGTYMQALPAVYSVDAAGTRREFLAEAFADAGAMLSALFLKGYQWPFDADKVFGGSSVIDLLVYRETVCFGRRVYLDYRTDPVLPNGHADALPFEALTPEAYRYLSNAGALLGTPFERLYRMNAPAAAFYREHGVDLAKEPLEIAVCAQHHNGGFDVDENWQTNVAGLYAVGECACTHGVRRPGGSALNAGQVGAIRVFEHIALRIGLPEPEERPTESDKAALRRFMSGAGAPAGIPTPQRSLCGYGGSCRRRPASCATKRLSETRCGRSGGYAPSSAIR